MQSISEKEFTQTLGINYYQCNESDMYVEQTNELHNLLKVHTGDRPYHTNSVNAKDLSDTIAIL